MERKEKYKKACIIIMFLMAFSAFLFCLIYSTMFNAMQFLFLSLCILFPLLINIIFKLKIPFYLIFVYMFFLVAHFIMGEILNFYVFVSYYDTMLHYLSAICICFLGFHISNYTLKDNIIYKIAFSFMFGMSAEFLWEILEYSIDHFCNTNMQRFIKDGIILVGHMALYDTIKDMIVALSGCMTFVIVLLLFLKRKKSHKNGIS